MPGPTRQDRLAAHLYREIATAVRGLDDPRLGLLTITRVEMTADLQLATAFWTVLGGERERKLATHALESARGHIRAGYAKSVRTRLVPDLRFSFDDREEKRQAMQSVIERARRTDPDHGQRPEPAIEDPDGPVAPPVKPPPTP